MKGLFGLLVFVAVNAVGGAIYGVAGADSVPEEWLDGSPFDSYLIPSLYLGLAVGGSHLVAAVLVWKRSVYATASAYVASAVLASWIVAQVAMIGYVSPLQPVMFGVAAVTALLARRST